MSAYDLIFGVKHVCVAHLKTVAGAGRGEDHSLAVRRVKINQAATMYNNTDIQ